MKKITKKQIRVCLITILIFTLAIAIFCSCAKTNKEDATESTTNIAETTDVSQTEKNDTSNETTTTMPAETTSNKESIENSKPDETISTNPTEQTEETKPEKTEPEPTKKPTENTKPSRPKPTEPSVPKESEPQHVQTEPTEETKPHTHKYNRKTTKKATCTNDGVNTFTCSCGKSYTEKIDKTGHKWSEWKTTKEPTTDTEGNSQRTCSTCQESENKTISKLPPENPNNDTVVTKSQLQQIEKGFLSLVNDERKKVGVSELTTNSHLESVAQTRSNEIISKWSHTRPNGEPFHSLIDVNTYPYITAGENLCITSHVGTNKFTDEDIWTGSAEQIEAAYSWIFNCFKNSPGHYANMIDADFKNCGIGISYVIYDNDGIPMFHVSHIFGTK